MFLVIGYWLPVTSDGADSCVVVNAVKWCSGEVFIIKIRFMTQLTFIFSMSSLVDSYNTLNLSNSSFR